MTEGVTDRQAHDSIRLFLIGSDPIFQLGLRTGLEQDPAIQVIGAASSSNALWSVLATTRPPDIFVVDLDPLGIADETLIVLCRQLKNSFPNQPVLVLVGRVEVGLLSQLRQAGVEGYSPKGVEIQSLYRILRNLMQGESAWSTAPIAEQESSPGRFRVAGLSRLRLYLRQTSLQQIQSRRQRVAQDLENERIAWWEWVVLSGQLREVNAAQALIEQLFPAPERLREASAAPNMPPIAALSRVLPRALSTPSHPEALAPEDAYRSIKSAVLDQLTAKLTLSSANLTGTPLEVDLLRLDRKQELFLIVLKQFEDLLDELRFSGVSRSQLVEKRSQMLRDLWQNVLTDFLGKYRTISSVSTLAASEPFIEVVPQLLLDESVVEINILICIPLFVELVDHLLFHSDLMLDQQLYPVGSLEAFLQTEALLGNTVIQVANAVVQPLLNRFSTHDSIRRDFFDRRWLSTREIERFRNALSWKYRVQQWFVEPKNIFESQHRLMVFGETGIKYRAIYAPRDRELQTLSGLPFVITLALEARDAIAPPLQAAVTFLGRGFVYLLTQVIGRSIGLVGRGVLQGVGYMRSEVRSRPAPSADQRQP